ALFWVQGGTSIGLIEAIGRAGSAGGSSNRNSPAGIRGARSPSVPGRPQFEPQEVLRGIQFGDPSFERDAARAGDGHAVTRRPGLAGVTDEQAVVPMVLDEGGEVGEHSQPLSGLSAALDVTILRRFVEGGRQQPRPRIRATRVSSQRWQTAPSMTLKRRMVPPRGMDAAAGLEPAASPPVQ